MSSHKPGFESALQAIRVLGTAERNKLLDTMAQQDPELVAELRAALFEFKDLVKLSAEEIRVLTDKVADNVWALAFRNASDDLKNFILTKMVRRRAEGIRELIDSLGPQPLSKVEEAQAEILKHVEN